MQNNDFFAACKSEVIGLHDFFVEWMGAHIDRNPLAFERFANTTAESFFLVNPDGSVSERETLLPDLESTYGARPDFKIWIKDCQCRFVSENHCLITYEEWHDLAGVGSSRLSSALFERREGTPNGVVWLSVHETWLDENAG